MIVKIHLIAIEKIPKIVEIEIPKYNESFKDEENAEIAFAIGQEIGEFRSPTAGDIAELPSGKLFIFKAIGTPEISKEDYESYIKLPVTGKMGYYL